MEQEQQEAHFLLFQVHLFLQQEEFQLFLQLHPQVADTADIMEVNLVQL